MRHLYSQPLVLTPFNLSLSTFVIHSVFTFHSNSTMNLRSGRNPVPDSDSALVGRIYKAKGGVGAAGVSAHQSFLTTLPEIVLIFIFMYSTECVKGVDDSPVLYIREIVKCCSTSRLSREMAPDIIQQMWFHMPNYPSKLAHDDPMYPNNLLTTLPRMTKPKINVLLGGLNDAMWPDRYNTTPIQSRVLKNDLVARVIKKFNVTQRQQLRFPPFVLMSYRLDVKAIKSRRARGRKIEAIRRELEQKKRKCLNCRQLSAMECSLHLCGTCCRWGEKTVPCHRHR